MKLQIASDLHLPFWLARGISLEQLLDEMQTDADVLVLAGDITELRPTFFDHTKDVFEAFCRRWPDVVYIPGNHEFYHTSIMDGLSNLFELKLKFDDTPMRFHVLHPGLTPIIKGQRFVGGTMWQPWPHPAEMHGISPISDHTQIRDFHKEAPAQFEAFYKFAGENLSSGDIVVTHHTPSYQSCAPQFEGSTYNYWFHTPAIEPLLSDAFPRLWIHGHTHTPFDYVHQPSGVRVVCNPRGYPGEGVAFNPKLVVEV